MRSILGCLLLLVPLVAGVASIAPAQPAPPEVPVATVAAKLIPESIAAVGVLEARIHAVLAAQVDGRVAEPPLREGSAVSVEKGTVVCRLDSSDRAIDLREAQAALAAASARALKMRSGLRKEEIDAHRAAVSERQALFDQSEAAFNRTKKLFEDEIVDRSELERVASVYLASRSLLSRAQADLTLAEAGYRDEEIAEAAAEEARQKARVARVEDEIAKSSVRSPVSGIVVRRLTEAGQWVSRGGAVAEVADLSRVRVKTSVTEREIARVAIGDVATVLVDAWPDRPFSGKVTSVVPSAEPGTRTFRVWIETDNPDGALMDGMFARVSITAKEPRRTLVVPAPAVVLTSRGPIVYVVRDGVALAVPVEVGRTLEGAVALRKGEISAGDSVVVGATMFLSPLRPNPVTPVTAESGR